MRLTFLQLTPVFLTLIYSTVLHAAEPVKLRSTFSADEIAWFTAEGTAAVKGISALSLKDGSKIGCAGYTIELIPTSKYADERIFLTYGNNKFGKVLIEDNPPKFTPDAPGYHSTTRKTTCNNNNKFWFRQLPAGDYYIFAFIITEEKVGSAEPAPGGGAIMKKITLHENELLEINLSK